MLFNSILSAALLCATTFAAPAISSKQDAKPVISALSSISTAVQALAVETKAFTGDPAAANKLVTDAQGLITVMQQATASITPITQLALLEATQVLTPANALIATVKDVTDSLIAKKDLFAKQNLSPKVAKTLTDIKGEAANLITAIKTKLPSGVASVGDNIAKQINASLDKGIAQFQ